MHFHGTAKAACLYGFGVFLSDGQKHCSGTLAWAEAVRSVSLGEIKAAPAAAQESVLENMLPS